MLDMKIIAAASVGALPVPESGRGMVFLGEQGLMVKSQSGKVVAAAGVRSVFVAGTLTNQNQELDVTMLDGELVGALGVVLVDSSGVASQAAEADVEVSITAAGALTVKGTSESSGKNFRVSVVLYQQ